MAREAASPRRVLLLDGANAWPDFAVTHAAGSEDVRTLHRRLAECPIRLRSALRAAWQRLDALEQAGKDSARGRAEFLARLAAAEGEVAARRASVPPLRYPEDLPVAALREEIVAAIRQHPVLVVCGETGSGKTTQLPKLCLDAGRGILGKIGHTQPRRLAARTVAARIAEELVQPVGQAVGYKIRFRDTTQPGALIKLMTDGILLAETQTDRYLNAYDTLIIDEAHERSLNIDFLLGYLKWLMPRRPDLKVIITSATIDPDRFSRHFDGAPVLNVTGRTYPVEVRYRPVEGEEGDETERTLQQAIVDAVDELACAVDGDVLVFLSGEREIRETAESLRKHHPSRCEVLPLYSRLSFAEQDRVFRAHDRRRIVLATNVAETSLTVPGIRAVVDAGYARISRYSHRSKLQRLPVEKIAQSSANQRAGRCGRLGPGVCIRLYSEADYLSRPEFTEPELLRTNLAAVILQMHALRLGEIESFPFLEVPDERLVRDGHKTLQELNALDGAGRLTPLGQRLARLPLDPRQGAMLLAADRHRCLTEALIIVAGLAVQDVRERPLDKSQAADLAHARFKHEQSDFLAMLNLWGAWQEQKKQLSTGRLRAWCRDGFLSFLRLREWDDVHHHLSQLVRGEMGLKPNEVPASYQEIHLALLTGLLTQVAGRTEQGEYLGVRNAKLHIHPGSHLARGKPRWIVAAEQVETSRVYARTVARIEPEWIEQCGAHLIKRQHTEPHWERKPQRVAALERVTLYGLTLRSGHKVAYERINPVETREIFIREALVQQDFDCHAAFFDHNRKMLESADYLQQKGRRVDLVVDEAWLFEFYDQRIPAEVVSGASFDRWRRVAERTAPRHLFLDPEDITRQEDDRLDAVNFPDHIESGGQTVALTYRFLPGDPEDGVTAIIPLHRLNQINPAPFGWLVPGLLRDRAIALVKSLPKAVRRHFVPVPDSVDRCLGSLEQARGDGLPQALGRVLAKTFGVRVDEDAWDETGVPAHLRMNFHLVDEAGVVLDQGRDLAALKARWMRDAGERFAQKAHRVLRHTGQTRWVFDDVPETFAEDGVMGYPALVDEGATVGLALFATEAEAARAQRAGLTRLIALALGKEARTLARHFPVSAACELSYARLPASPGVVSPANPPDLRGDLTWRVVQTVFVDAQPDIRDEAAFRARLAQPPARLFEQAGTAGQLVAEVFVQLSVLRTSLASWPQTDPIAQDARDQLERMLGAGFVRDTPWIRLREVPRYLKALAHRLDKARSDPARDARGLASLQPFWDAYWSGRGTDALLAAEDEYRWLLEEYRVSLFAQHIKTARPVSAKRLREAGQVRGGP